MRWRWTAALLLAIVSFGFGSPLAVCCDRPAHPSERLAISHACCGASSCRMKKGEERASLASVATVQKNFVSFVSLAAHSEAQLSGSPQIASSAAAASVAAGTADTPLWILHSQFLI